MFSTAERVWGGVGAGFAVGVLSTALVWAVSGPEVVTGTLEVPGPTITRTQTITSSQTVSETLTATSTVVNTTTAVISVPTTATEYVDVDGQGTALTDQPGISGSAATPLVTEYVNVPAEAVTVTERLEPPASTASAPQVPSNCANAEGASPEAGRNCPGSWMTELVPQVDPAGLGEWRFEVHPETGAWGTTDGYTVWIDPQVPQDYRYSVMVHEYAHILQRIHYGSLDEASKQTDFESLADCMALQMGATYTSYGCDDQLVPVARQILGG